MTGDGKGGSPGVPALTMAEASVAFSDVSAKARNFRAAALLRAALAEHSRGCAACGAPGAAWGCSIGLDIATTAGALDPEWSQRSLTVEWRWGVSC